MRHGRGPGAGIGERRAGRPGGAGRACSWSPRSPPSRPGGEVDAGRGLAGTIGRRLACGPRLPDACGHHPLVPAYGWPLARLARALAPAPVALPGPSGLPLVPVDFRRCRRESCAVAAGPHLDRLGPPHHRLHRARSTAAASLGWVELVYWLYRPASAGNASSAAPTAADVEAAARTPKSCSGRPRPGPARDPARPQPLRVPGRRTPALADGTSRAAIPDGRAEARARSRSSPAPPRPGPA